MGYRNTFIAVFASLALVGCDPKREERPCLNMGNPSALVSGAAIVRIDVYGASVHCDGSTVSASAGAPELSRSFGAGQKIQLDVSPGHHTFVLTTFSDTAGSVPLGEGCTEADVSPGSRLCFDPALKPISACRTGADCVATDGGSSATPFCDPATHRCVQCLTNAECGGVGGGACCGNHCVNTATDKNNCGVCGTVCQGDGATCCSGGCATLASDFNNCGTCGKVCSANHITPMCAAGSCEAAICSPAFVDCNGDKRTDGCECPGNGCCAGNKCQNQHDNGVGGAYYDCDKLGTYDSGHATAAALSANPSGSPSGATCTGSTPDGGVQESQDVICSHLPNGNCACWTYRATGVSVMWIGYVNINGTSDCYCPSPGGNNHPWN
jgi:hypothetical protein